MIPSSTPSQLKSALQSGAPRPANGLAGVVGAALSDVANAEPGGNRPSLDPDLFEKQLAALSGAEQVAFSPDPVAIDLNRGSAAQLGDNQPAEGEAVPVVPVPVRDDALGAPDNKTGQTAPGQIGQPQMAGTASPSSPSSPSSPASTAHASRLELSERKETVQPPALPAKDNKAKNSKGLAPQASNNPNPNPNDASGKPLPGGNTVPESRAAPAAMRDGREAVLATDSTIGDADAADLRPGQKEGERAVTQLRRAAPDNASLDERSQADDRPPKRSDIRLEPRPSDPMRAVNEQPNFAAGSGPNRLPVNVDQNANHTFQTAASEMGPPNLVLNADAGAAKTRSGAAYAPVNLSRVSQSSADNAASALSQPQSKLPASPPAQPAAVAFGDLALEDEDAVPDRIKTALVRATPRPSDTPAADSARADSVNAVPSSSLTPVSASANLPGNTAAPVQSISAIAPSAMDKGISPQIGQAIDHVAEIREAARAARPEIMVRHAEFGAVNMRIEAMGGDLRAVLSNRDPGFVPAVQAALTDRAASALSETTNQNNNHSGSRNAETGSNGTQSGNQNPGNWGAGANTGQSYGSFLGGQGGAPKPSSEHLDGEQKDSLSRGENVANGRDHFGTRDSGLFA